MEADYYAIRGHALDMGTETIAASAGSLTGSSILVSIGRKGVAPAVTLDSASPPLVSVCEWTPGSTSGTLKLDLSEDDVDALTPGYNFVQITLVNSDGRPLLVRTRVMHVDPGVSALS